jgi:NADPH-dependent glutamate synthase beta subunit-like oxidoreductase
MPAANEVHEALVEGARAIFQAAPTRVVTDGRNRVTGVEFQRMRLGEPDASGRRRPEPVAGTEFIIECDRVLLAIGQGPDLTWLERGADGVAATKNKRLDADAVTFTTGRLGVFGAGDVRIGAATVVQRTCAATTSTPSGPARRWPSRSQSSCRSSRTPAR